MIVIFEWKKELLPAEALIGVWLVGLLIFMIFVAVEALILRGMFSLGGETDCEYLIVLGAKVNGYRMSGALKNRMEKAAEYLHAHPQTRVIVAGGQGHGELVTEAYAMAQYLKKEGIDQRRILKEEKSTTTRENLVYSSSILLEDKKHWNESVCYGTKEMAKNVCMDSGVLKSIKVGIVTNNFHIYRARKIAEQVGYGKVLPLATSTNKIMFVNYMTREFFAVLKMWVNRKRGRVKHF